MSDELRTIGDFAAASGLTPKALRLYDDLGLLVPAETDPVTGYRRYATAQLGRARLVARLRLAGMPLARIREVADLPTDAAVAGLVSWWRQVEADHGTASALVADLVAHLQAQEEPTTAEDPMTEEPRPGTRRRPATAARSGRGARTAALDATRTEGDLHAVADGFGDEPGVAEEVLAALPRDPGPDPVAALDDAVARARGLLAEHGPDAGDREVGCTLTALLLHGGRAVLAHVGDSRAHLVRDGRLTRLTRDHTVVQTLLDEGRLTPEEARSGRRRAVLNRAVAGGHPHPPDLALLEVRPGDRFVLTTKGVHAEVDPASLAGLLVAPVPADRVADDVAASVLAAGAADHWSVVVVDVPA